MLGAATCRPRPAAFTPPPRHDRRRRPPRPTPPLRAPAGDDRTPRRPALGKLIVTSLAALLLLVGPLVSSAIGTGSNAAGTGAAPAGDTGTGAKANRGASA